jgi:hypothetical protein
MELVPTADVVALGQFLVEHAVAVEEDGSDGAWERAVGGVVHLNR